MKNKNNARVIAYYLPQYHPIPENDNWWGKGFTEWTNVSKARKLFRNHYQPHIPADLGFYDLRVPETRKAQADLARDYGVEGFCYWHYWFGNGKRLLERPFNEVLKSGEPDFPFCLGWANDTWKGFAHGLKNRNTLIEQLYPGEDDYRNHFFAILDALKDKRYIKVEGKPLFMIFSPLDNSEVKNFIITWRNLAIQNGLEGIYFIGHCNNLRHKISDIFETGVDAVNTVRVSDYLVKKQSFIEKIFVKGRRFLGGFQNRYTYAKMSKYFIDKEIDSKNNIYPSIIPGWDHTPRSGKEGLVITDSRPDLFGKHIDDALECIKNREADKKIIFIKSWNEWAEGNYMEPDLKWGTKYLETLRNKIHQ